MAKEQKNYFCTECGAVYIQWRGKCDSCGEWNTIFEKQEAGSKKKLTLLSEVDSREAARSTTKISELDRVFGGGIVKGSLNLLAGDPGIGKSTLALQASSAFDSVLYIAGEESPSQIKIRAERIIKAETSKIIISTETSVEYIVEEAKKIKPALLIIDSIQTVTVNYAAGTGAINQMREAAAYLLRNFKETGIPVLVIGHVTKSGDIAGPMLLEHLVDVVLMMESDTSGTYRMLRCVKNRFGSIDEVGLFAMRDKGLEEILNPSELLLPSHSTQVPGSAITASMEGRRPLLIELQALTIPTSFGTPRRIANGIDPNRLSMILAVLERRAKLPLGNSDVYLNTAGGFKLKEPAVDLGIVMAAASSLLERAVPDFFLFIGEVGLGGEIRTVGKIESRLKEAAKLGFKYAYIPDQKIETQNDIKIKKINNINEALCLLKE